MAKELVNYTNIPHFIGGEDTVNEFDRLIREAAEDCAKRSDIAKPRKVLLQLELSPDEKEIIVNFQVKHAFPPKQGGIARATIDRSGKLFANPASDDSPEQKTLDEAQE